MKSDTVKRLAFLKVTVDYLGNIRRTLGVEQTENIELKDNASVSDLLLLLAEKHGDPFKKAVYEPKEPDLKPYHILSINGLLLNQLHGIETKLKDGDRVVLMPVVTGG
jgi:molybdopterin synthase sulfur carrier subunit